MPILHGRAKGSQLQENLCNSKILSDISTGLWQHFAAVFSMPIRIISQASDYSWGGLSTDLLYKNVTKDFTENEDFVIYLIPSLVTIVALRYYYGLEVQINTN